VAVRTASAVHGISGARGGAASSQENGGTWSTLGQHWERKQCREVTEVVDRNRLDGGSAHVSGAFMLMQVRNLRRLRIPHL